MLNTLIWSKFGDLIASIDYVKRRSIEVLAVKDPEVGAFACRYGLMLVIAKVWTERKSFKKGNI